MEKNYCLTDETEHKPETTHYIKSEDFVIKAVGSIEKFSGFKEVYNFKDNDKDVQNLPNLDKNSKLKQKKYLQTKFHKPPNRYFEAGLVKT